MKRLLLNATLGMGVLALAPANVQAGTFAHPGYIEGAAAGLQIAPQRVQAGKPDAARGSYTAPKGGGDASRGPRRGGDDGRRDGRRPDGRAWRGRPGPRYVAPGRHYYRPWSRRPYYGRVLGGIALGAIVGVAVIGLVPPSPDPDLCWYWADPYRSRGYWDYCD